MTDQLLQLLRQSASSTPPTSPLGPLAGLGLSPAPSVDRPTSPEPALPDLSHLVPPSHGPAEAGPRLPASVPKQRIELQDGTVDSDSQEIKERQVEIVAPARDGGSGFLSRKVETQDITIYKSSWLPHMHRILAANERFIVYSVKAKSGGAIRAISLVDGQKALLKAQTGLPTGMPADLQFAGPTSDLLATVDELGTFVIWQLVVEESGMLVGRHRLRYNADDQSFGKFQVAWHPDGHHCAFLDASGLHLWNTQPALVSPDPTLFVGNVESSVPQQKQTFGPVLPVGQPAGILPVFTPTGGETITGAAFSRADTVGVRPSGDTVAIATSAGMVLVYERPAASAPFACSRRWIPHDKEAPVTLVEFCTATSSATVDGPAAGCSHPLLLTATAGNSELALWDTRSWECQQLLRFVPQGASHSQLSLAVHVSGDSRYIAVAERARSLCYILRLDAPPPAVPGSPRNYGRPRVTFLDQFSLRYPVLGQVISSCAVVPSDEGDGRVDAVIKAYCLLTKEIKACTFRFPVADADWSQSSVLVDSHSLPDLPAEPAVEAKEKAPAAAPPARTPAAASSPAAVDESNLLSALKSMMSSGSTEAAVASPPPPSSAPAAAAKAPGSTPFQFPVDISPIPAALPSAASVDLTRLEESFVNAAGGPAAAPGLADEPEPESPIPESVLQARDQEAQARIDSLRRALSHEQQARATGVLSSAASTTPSEPSTPAFEASPPPEPTPPVVSPAVPSTVAALPASGDLLELVRHQSAQLASLTSIVTAQQKELSALRAEVSRSQNNVVSRVNRLFEKHFEAQRQENARERQAIVDVDREKHQRLLRAISESLHAGIAGTITAAMRQEVTAMLPGLATELSSRVETGIQASVQALLADGFRRFTERLRTTIPNILSSGEVAGMLATSLGQSMTGPMQASFQAALAACLPALDASFKEMFQQINTTFQAGTAQVQAQLGQAAAASASAAPAIDKAQLDAVFRGFLETQQGLRSKDNATIQKFQQQTLQAEMAKLNRFILSASQTVQLLSTENYERGFTTALSANNISLVMFACKSASLETLLRPGQVQLSQPVILSLVQQLALELEVELAPKLELLMRAIQAVDRSDPRTNAIVPQVFGNLVQKLTAVQAQPGLDAELSGKVAALSKFVYGCMASMGIK